MKNEIKVKYQESFDRFLAMTDGTISSVVKFNGVQIFLDELGVVIGYLINAYSGRYFLNNVFLKFLGRPFAEMEEICGLT